jgi:Glu-tRNA(Gln) amidotransferase subunit E-like FAD-binding protein
MTKVYAWVDIDSQLRSRQTNLKDITHPADEPGWQGLTDDDVNEITKDVIAFKSDVVAFIRSAEAKLKEKNT